MVKNSVKKKAKRKRTKKTSLYKPKRSSKKPSLSKTELKQKKELSKLRRRRTWADKGFSKCRFNGDSESKKKAHKYFTKLQALNKKINTLEYREPVFKPLELNESDGWKSQGFGGPQRCAQTFFDWFEDMHKFFNEINYAYGIDKNEDGSDNITEEGTIFLPDGFLEVIMVVNDMVSYMDSTSLLVLRYKKRVGFLQIE